MTDAERVIFLLQPAGSAYLEGMTTTSAESYALIASALAEYPDPKLAAAFVLDMLCATARVAATAENGQIRSFTVGPIKIERAVNSGSIDVARADGFRAQAALLRREVRRSRSAAAQLASPTFIRDSRLGTVDDLIEDMYQ